MSGPNEPRLQIPYGMSRRDFLRLMGASVVMASLAGCREHAPQQSIIPYSRTPESAQFGPYTHYATAFVLDGYGLGLLALDHTGRPIKIEGNPRHPSSLGGTDIFSQASLYDLYNPQRASEITGPNSSIHSWPELKRALGAMMKAHASDRGRGLRLLLGPTTSPTRIRLLKEIQNKYPEVKFVVSTSLPRSAVSSGTKLAFSRPLHPIYHTDRAQVIAAFDDDLIGSGPGHLRYARDWMQNRVGDRPDFNPLEFERGELFVVEPAWTLTGGVAQWRLPIRRSRVALLMRELARQAGVIQDATPTAGLDERERNWLARLWKALDGHRGRSLVTAGLAQGDVIHELAHRINERLGNISQTVSYVEPFEFDPGSSSQSLTEAARDMKAGLVQTLVLLSENPVFDLPPDIDFQGAMSSVATRVHLSLYRNETSIVSTWHVPEAHDLERWGDVRAHDGTASLIQPLISPLYNGHSSEEILSLLLDGENGSDSYTLVRETWQKNANLKGPDFEGWWRRQLTAGLIEKSAAPEINPTISAPVSTRAAGVDPSLLAPSSRANGEFELVFAPDPSIWDGRFVNNAWLQELPKPFTRIVWDNAVLLSPGAARRLGVRSQDLVEVRVGDQAVSGPVFVLEGQPDDVAVVHFGYGAAEPGGLGGQTGFDAFRLRSSSSPWVARGARLRKLKGQYLLASTQQFHQIQDEKPPVRVIKPGEKAEREKPPGIKPDWVKTADHRWGMVIDLEACIACNACTIACQVENNIPVVGKKQVLLGREMHWIRVDRYTREEAGRVKFDVQPVPCMHCETAPCEYVCPVNATNHSQDGLNQMVYNRCIGTRFCSNNCPYKVRRFNFLHYTGFQGQKTLQMAYNPEVTVRSRGVMEKCTYCIQRINNTRIHAQIEGRRIRDGEIQTACQQVCPTQAIVFGDLGDANARVAKLREDPRQYSLLAELGTLPRTTYLAKRDET